MHSKSVDLILVCGVIVSLVYTQCWGLNLVNQKSRKLGVFGRKLGAFDRKLEGNHSPFYCNFDKKKIQIIVQFANNTCLICIKYCMFNKSLHVRDLESNSSSHPNISFQVD